ncbi:MAG TPA: mechanosensitive ion channel domain-containing protein [Chitinophagaceae bacterium]|nr:mechanosensitive ion channel domain-containing protein [Chitinophagaceae bacterium]
MNDFLEQVWLDNTVKNYFIIAGIILFVVILKRFISRYLAGLLFKIVNKIWKDVDKKSFTNLLIQPLGFFLLILVSIISLHKLNFPVVLNAEVYGYSVKQILHALATIILIGSFIWLLLRIIDFIAIILGKKADLTPDQSDNQLIVFFRDFFKVVIAIVGIMMVLNYAFDLNVGSLITGLSIVGAAIALALRESLENLIASFIIFFDKPFTTGDLVKVQNITGTVEKIGLRSTRIRSENKTLVSVPNKQMVDSVLDNLSLRTQRRGDLKLELDLQTNSAKLVSLLTAVRKIMTRPEIEENTVLLSEITANSFIVNSDYYTAPLTIKEFNIIREVINLQVLKELETSGIELAGSNKEIRIISPTGS